MAYIQSIGSVIGAIGLCLFVINFNTCRSQQLNVLNDFDTGRAYTPDTGLLDFVYHNHDDMTRFLRYLKRFFKFIFNYLWQ